ncbi:MAG: FtsK/SpoIIIE domain-containing protein [Nitrospirota bacterium]
MHEETKNPATELLSLAKKHGIENPLVYRALIGIALDPDEDMIENFWELVMPTLTFNRLFTSPFPKPGNEVDGLLRFGISENKKAVGINPEECHVLIAGQTGTGKSTLLKVIFASALLLDRKQKEEGQSNGKNNLLVIR